MMTKGARLDGKDGGGGWVAVAAGGVVDARAARGPASGGTTPWGLAPWLPGGLLGARDWRGRRPRGDAPPR